MANPVVVFSRTATGTFAPVPTIVIEISTLFFLFAKCQQGPFGLCKLSQFSSGSIDTGEQLDVWCFVLVYINFTFEFGFIL